MGENQIYLLEGLRSALEDLGRNDLLPMLDLVDQDAQAAWVLSNAVI